MCIYIYIHTHIHTYLYMFIHIYMYVHIHILMIKYLYIYVYIHIYVCLFCQETSLGLRFNNWGIRDNDTGLRERDTYTESNTHTHLQASPSLAPAALTHILTHAQRHTLSQTHMDAPRYACFCVCVCWIAITHTRGVHHTHTQTHLQAHPGRESATNPQPHLSPHTFVLPQDAAHTDENSEKSAS